MYLVVGCGLSGATIAEQIATKLNKKIIIIDKRNHIGGNCYDYLDPDTDILINKYGAHLFHTNNEIVWNYVNKFSDWIRWEHKVLSYVDNKFVSIPVNITTVNELCNENITDSHEMRIWLDCNQVKFKEITNSEEMAKSRIGNILYNKLIHNYTFKQWNIYPNKLDKSVLERIPIRDNFDTRYFSDKYQVLPKNGYTKFISNILTHKNIEIKLNTSYDEYIKNNKNNFDKIIFTGPIDDYFKDLPKLEYRSINFTKEIYKSNLLFF